MRTRESIPEADSGEFANAEIAAQAAKKAVQVQQKGLPSPPFRVDDSVFSEAVSARMSQTK